MLEGGGMKMNKTFSVLSIYAYVYCLVPDPPLLKRQTNNGYNPGLHGELLEYEKINSKWGICQRV